jgi:hypothetical protein
MTSGEMYTDTDVADIDSDANTGIRSRSTHKSQYKNRSDKSFHRGSL